MLPITLEYLRFVENIHACDNTGITDDSKSMKSGEEVKMKGTDVGKIYNAKGRA